ncbi:MAG: tyrosine-type recombinase/integrase [Poseidonibacter sp.]|uniref:tyrosine-type recombinase/integrase n=1 Tax=Poseidonibacter sp. TaxID=2321188 RepID=UPI00359E9C76
MSKKEFIRRIPEEYQSKLGLQRLKVSLIKCKNKTQVEKAKMLLYFQSEKIFENINEYDKLKAKSYLKNSLYEYLLNSDINVKSLTTKVEETIHKITIIDIFNKEIDKREIDFKVKMKALEKRGVDISIKKDKTYDSYITIKNHLLTFKCILEKDYKDINNDDIEEFKYFLLEKNVGLSSIASYFKHLKAIFNRLIKAQKITFNPIIVPSVESLSEDKKMFAYSDITTILDNLGREDSLLFKTLLYTGMRLDELSSIKKKNIRNDAFYFFDSKNKFRKIVPIHENILDEMNKIFSKINDDDYIFKNNIKGKNRVDDIRNPFNDLFKKLDINRTLHKTRATFITYLNFYNDNFNSKDITTLTHSLQGMDDKKYVVAKNIDKLRLIVNSIDLTKIKEIEKYI